MEGPHGVGKTTLFESIKRKRKYVYLSEEFVPKPNSVFHPQSFENELKWVLRCFNRIRGACTFNKNSETYECSYPIVMDRSMFTAAVYAKSGRDVIKKVIDKLISEHEKKGVFIHVVFISGNQEKIMQRIKFRSKQKGQEWRAKLSEMDPDWLKLVIRRYNELGFDENYKNVINAKNDVDLTLKLEKVIDKIVPNK